MVALTEKQLERLREILKPFLDELEAEIQSSGLDIEAVRMSRKLSKDKATDWNIGWETK